MKHKRQTYRRILLIYILYFLALISNLASDDFRRGYQDATAESAPSHDRFEYIVTAPVDAAHSPVTIEGLPENITPTLALVQMKVTTDEAISLGNLFRMRSDNVMVFVLLFAAVLAGIAVLILFALIINSLRKSIRDDRPIHHANIARTRWIGGLILFSVACDCIIQNIDIATAVHLTEGTALHIADGFRFDSWNFIIGLLFFFMGELFSIGSQLGEEQKLTV